MALPGINYFLNASIMNVIFPLHSLSKESYNFALVLSYRPAERAKKSYSSDGRKATKIILSEQHTYVLFTQLSLLDIKCLNNK